MIPETVGRDGCATSEKRPPIGDSTRDFGNRPEIQSSPTWYEVHIEKVANGWIVRIGCKTFVSTSWQEITEKLWEYWEDPLTAQKRYCK
jgi:hypothetical protein